MRARDVMTSEVVTVDPETSIADVAKLMLEHWISGVPVVDSSRIVGIITEENFVDIAADLLEKRLNG